MLLPTISYLTDIHFASGAVDLLPQILIDRRIARPLLVTDPGIVSAGLVQRLPCEFAATFDRVDANPTLQNVQNGVSVYRDADCDGIVVFGGGSPIDCGKAVSLMVTHDEPLEQYALIRGGLSGITSSKPPVIAIPTTSGTGSEVGRAALITFNATTKLAIVGRAMIPDVAVCDPALTLQLPPVLTAATGMDAISHCVETFCSPKFNPVADAIALDGLQRACGNLRTVVESGTDRAARAEMMMASVQGALAFQKGLGMIHSLSHPLGALPLRLHHGTLNSIFLPHVLRFNHEACVKKTDRMAEAIGLIDGSELPDYFQQLAADLGLPVSLGQLGLTADDLLPLAEPALADHSTATNPRPLTLEDCAEMYQAAL